MVLWTLNHFSGPLSAAIMSEVARGGYIWALELFQSDQNRNTFPCEQDILNEAAGNYHWSIVHWLHEVNKNTQEEKASNTTLVTIAIEQSNLLQLKWAIAKGYGSPSFIGWEHYHDHWTYTTEKWETQREMFEYVLNEQIVDTGSIIGRAMMRAAEFDDLEFIQGLMVRNPTDEFLIASAVRAASKNGHLSVVQWIMTRLKTTPDMHLSARLLIAAMFAAAKTGKLVVVQYLYEHWFKDVFIIFFDEDDLFQEESGLHTQGYRTVMDIAAAHGHLEVLEYLRGVSKKHKKRGWIFRKSEWRWHHGKYSGCTAAAIDGAAGNGHLDVVKWLHTHRSEGCTKKAMNSAAACGYLSVVKWLHATRREGCTTSAIDIAVKR